MFEKEEVRGKKSNTETGVLGTNTRSISDRLLPKGRKNFTN